MRKEKRYVTMRKPAAFFILLVFLCNVFVPVCFSAPKETTSLTQNEKETPKSKKEDGSALSKIIGTLIYPLAYGFHLLWFQIFGRPKVTIGCDITLQNNKEIQDLTIYLPYVLLNGKPVSDKDLRGGLKRRMEGNYEVYRTDYNYQDKILAKKVKSEKINTKRGPMLMLYVPKFRGWSKREGFNYVGAELGTAPMEVNEIFPYYLSTEFTINPEKEIEKWKVKKRRAEVIASRRKKISTWVYISWKGGGYVKLNFAISVGGRFGLAGRNGLWYALTQQKKKKGMDYYERDTGPGSMPVQHLIFTESGWYEVAMQKGEHMAGR